LQRAKEAMKKGLPPPREDFTYTYQGTTYTTHLGSDRATDARPALPGDARPVSLAETDPARIAGSAYKNVGDLQALMARNVDYMLKHTSAQHDDDADYYLRRNTTNSNLPARFADDDLIAAYKQFIAGPLTEATAVRNRQLGLLKDGGPATFEPRDYVFTYRGQQYPVRLG
jgi:hypothetical protein